MRPSIASLLVIGCCLATPRIHAQSLTINDSAVWHEEHWLYDGLTAHHSIFTCRADGDTLIAGAVYSKIHQLGVDSVSTLGSSFPPVAVPLDRYLGAIRANEASLTWYVWLSGYPNELLLYDFDLEIGASTLGTYGDCGAGLTVTSIDEVMVGGSPRRRFHLNMPGRFIIEGVGGSAGLFGQLCQLFEEFSCLHVYEEPGASVLVDGCGTLSTDIVVVPTNARFLLVYPNPTRGPLHLTGAQPGMPIRLLDATGRVVHSTALTGPDGILDISAMPCGVYTLQMGTTTIRVMKE